MPPWPVDAARSRYGACHKTADQGEASEEVT